MSFLRYLATISLIGFSASAGASTYLEFDGFERTVLCGSVDEESLKIELDQMTFHQKTWAYYYYQGQMTGLQIMRAQKTDFTSIDRSQMDAPKIYVLDLFAEQQVKDLQLLNQKIENCHQRIKQIGLAVRSSAPPACVPESAYRLDNLRVLNYDCSNSTYAEFERIIQAMDYQEALLMEKFVRGRLRANYDFSLHIREDGRTFDVAKMYDLAEDKKSLDIQTAWTYEMNMSYPIFSITEKHYAACTESAGSSGSRWNELLGGPRCENMNDPE